MAQSCASSCPVLAEDARHHAGLQVPGVTLNGPHGWVGDAPCWHGRLQPRQLAAESWLASCEPRCEAPVLPAGF